MISNISSQSKKLFVKVLFLILVSCILLYLYCASLQKLPFDIQIQGVTASTCTTKINDQERTGIRFILLVKFPSEIEYLNEDICFSIRFSEDLSSVFGTSSTGTTSLHPSPTPEGFVTPIHICDMYAINSLQGKELKQIFHPMRLTVEVQYGDKVYRQSEKCNLSGEFL